MDHEPPPIVKKFFRRAKAGEDQLVRAKGVELSCGGKSVAVKSVLNHSE